MNERFKSLANSRSFHHLRRHWLTVAFIGGFLTDLLLLNRVDSLFDNLVLLMYVLLAMISIIALYAAAAGKLPARRRDAALHDVRNVRAAIELYRLQHNDVAPDRVRYPGWAKILKRTRADGTVDANGEFGPYLDEVMVNPVGGAFAGADPRSAPARVQTLELLAG